MSDVDKGGGSHTTPGPVTVTFRSLLVSESLSSQNLGQFDEQGKTFRNL